MKINDLKSSEAVIKPKESEKAEEFKADLIKLFNFLDSVDDDVLNVNDATVKLLEDILNGKASSNYSYNDMAKYVIIRNLANGESLTLENIVENYDEVFEMCQNDADAIELMGEMKQLFEEYELIQKEIETTAKPTNAISKDSEIYQKDARLSQIADEINGLSHLADKIDVQSRKNLMDADFLNKFNELYSELSARINFLRQKSEFTEIKNANTPAQFGLSTEEEPSSDNKTSSSTMNWGL